jgi:hypothetical protein
MYPNSPNIVLKLLTMVLIPNSIGSNNYKLIKSRSIIGINMSVSSREHYESKRSNIKIDIAVKIQCFLYDNSKYVETDEDIYKVERTFQNGQFMELYLIKINLRKIDIIDYA